MLSDALAYHAQDTPMHRLDARVKIPALFVFSLATVLAAEWWQLGICACSAVAAALVARIGPARLNRTLVPVYVLAAFSALCNFAASPGIDGMANGLFFAARMVTLVAPSCIVCLTTASSDLLEAFRFYIGPLRRLKAPVDDIALTLALSIRFIPVIESELTRILAAQRARGSESAPTLARKARNLAGAFAALFVGMFRHADTLADALDARCYGAVPRRSRLETKR